MATATVSPQPQPATAAKSQAAALAPPSAALSRPQPVSAVIPKPPAAVAAPPIAARAQSETSTAAVQKAVPASASMSEPPTAAVPPPIIPAASTALKAVAPSNVSVPAPSGPSIPRPVVRLVEIAKTNPQIMALINKVSSGQGTEEEQAQLTSIVDRIALEYSSSSEAVGATAQQLVQPKPGSSDPKNATAPPSLEEGKKGKKGLGTGLKSPESSKPPTPHLAKATLPTPNTSSASSRTASPVEVSTSTSTARGTLSPTLLSNTPAKQAALVKADGGATAAMKTTQPQNEKFSVMIEKGSWNTETKSPIKDNLSVRLIACNQSRVASTAPGMAYVYSPYRFDIDPDNFAKIMVESTPNAKTLVKIVFKKEPEGSGDRAVVMTFDRFVNPDTQAVESGRVQARRFARWFTGINASCEYSNKR